MSDDTGNHTKDQLLEAKLELIRGQMESGFNRLEGALVSHTREDDQAHAEIAKLADRLRELELEMARESTKLRLFMALVGLGGGGVGAAISKFVL